MPKRQKWLKTHFYFSRKYAFLFIHAEICGFAIEMPWIETDEHNQRLHNALYALSKERGAIERLAGSINDDAQASDTDRGRSGEKHQKKKALIAASTLTRWIEGGVDRIKGAQPHKKRLVFEYLERSPHYKTEIMEPAGLLPPGLLAYGSHNAKRLGQPFEKDLRDLDGVYRVFRPAWTVPALNRERVLVSRLRITSTGGFTAFREEQKFIDEEADDFAVSEVDDGAILLVGSNLIFLGLGIDGPRTKFLAAWSWFPGIGEGKPINRLRGVTLVASGAGPHSSFRFIALRTEDHFDDIETGILRPPHKLLSPNVVDHLELKRGDQSKLKPNP